MSHKFECRHRMFCSDTIHRMSPSRSILDAARALLCTWRAFRICRCEKRASTACKWLRSDRLAPPSSAPTSSGICTKYRIFACPAAAPPNPRRPLFSCPLFRLDVCQPSQRSIAHSIFLYIELYLVVISAAPTRYSRVRIWIESMSINWFVGQSMLDWMRSAAALLPLQFIDSTTDLFVYAYVWLCVWSTRWALTIVLYAITLQARVHIANNNWLAKTKCRTFARMSLDHSIIHR